MIRRRSLTVALCSATAFAGLALAPGQARADSTVPAWVIPVYHYDESTEQSGGYRACTEIELSPTRMLTGADCFTGRTNSDFQMGYDSSGQLSAGGSGPRYRTEPQFSATTRGADLAVSVANSPVTTARPVLATTADSALYAAGTTATFYSWPGPSQPEAVRHPHSEQAVIGSAADCATAIGGPLPAGTLCTEPVAGATPVDPSEQCDGDAGGALVAGGKLIGMSATDAAGCVRNGVRLYTDIRAHHSTVVEWTRDVDIDAYTSGSVLAREPDGIIDMCEANPDGWLDGCQVDDAGNMDDVFGTYNLLTEAGDLGGDGYGDLLARTTGGDLYRLTHPLQDSDLSSTPRVKLGTGWNIYNTIVAPRDISGDGLMDVIGRDASGGLWLYDGRGDGTLAPRVRIGTGWNIYTAITGRGDLSGDGISDLVARDTSGVLWLYRGNGHGGFAARTRVGGGWNMYNSIVASGDIDHDGRPDLTCRTPAGAVWVYDADGKGSFSAPRRHFVNRWKNYKAIS